MRAFNANFNARLFVQKAGTPEEYYYHRLKLVDGRREPEATAAKFEISVRKVREAALKRRKAGAGIF